VADEEDTIILIARFMARPATDDRFIWVWAAVASSLLKCRWQTEAGTV